MASRPDPFRHGYIATDGAKDPGALVGWRHTTLGDLDFHVHPRVRLARAEDRRKDVTVLVLGEVVDLDAATTDEDAICRAILKCATGPRQDAAVLRYVAYLGGRFACFVSSPAGLMAIPDCHASQPIYWTLRSGALFLASHAQLIGNASDQPVDTATLALLRQAKAMKTKGTLYFPGVRTTHWGVRPVLPNHYLARGRGEDAPHHRRFYPFDETRFGQSSWKEALSTFASAFMVHTQLLCRYGTTGISLTAGHDSNATFAAAYRHLGSTGFTFTFYRFDRPDEESIDDVIQSNVTSTAHRIPHRILRLYADQPTDDVFAQTYRETFGLFPQFPRVARAFNEQLPHDFFHLQSMMAETGTGFYKHRDTTTFDARRLSNLYSRFEFGRLPDVIDAHDEFIEYADFHPEHFGERVDYHDMFYWEARVPRWAVRRIQEADLSHRVLIPFNSRYVIEAMLSVPFDDRADKGMLAAFRAESGTNQRRPSEEGESRKRRLVRKLRRRRL